MPPVAKKSKRNDIIEVKKMRDYSNEPVFKKKTERVAEFVKKNGMPFEKKKK